MAARLEHPPVQGECKAGAKENTNNVIPCLRADQSTSKGSLGQAELKLPGPQGLTAPDPLTGSFKTSSDPNKIHRQNL